MKKKDHAEKQIRPRTFDEYVGQAKAVRTLKLFIDAVKKRGEATEHILLYGPPGIGKTTLAHIIANELKGDIKITSGAAITKTGDLAAILTNLKKNDILFIDEIHRLPKPVEEMLYPVIEDYRLDIIIGKGPAARTVRLPIPSITIVGATTKLALLSGPMRDRFGLILRLDFYQNEEMMEIVRRTAQVFNLPLSADSSASIASRSRRTPRIANRILKRARDYFEVNHHTVIDKALLDNLFDLLGLDKLGLQDIDLKYLNLIGIKHQNTPTGVETIASALAEDKQTIEEFVEPYLLQLSLIKKTPRGRTLTAKGLTHIHAHAYPQQQDKLV